MSHDVVIVGAGAAGCALAYRLSADPDVNVLLLEAGPDERPGLVRQPAQWPEGASSDYDPGHATTEQPAAGGRRIPLPRGRILGGSTCINAMIHAVPAPEAFHMWGPGWSWEDVEPSLRQLETHRGRGTGRGHEGPMANGPVLEPNPVCADFVTAAVQAGHAPRTGFEQGAGEGVGWFDLSIDDGERLDAAEAYLRPVRHRPNLTVRSNTTVTLVELRDGRVVGVRLSCQGVAEELEISGELVLCTGAIESPALLLRSGIGPGEELARVGVDCRVDLPAVGANLHDHPLVPVVWSSAHPVPPARNQLAESYLDRTHRPIAPGADAQRGLRPRRGPAAGRRTRRARRHRPGRPLPAGRPWPAAAESLRSRRAGPDRPWLPHPHR